MNKYFVSDDTEKIWIDDQHWVEIKSRLSIADQDKFNQSLWEIEVEQPEGYENLSRAERRRKARDEGSGMKVRPQFKPSTMVLLEIAIVNWSFEVPVSRENIGKLQPWIANMVEDEVNERNPLGRSTRQNTETSSKTGAQSSSPGPASDT